MSINEKLDELKGKAKGYIEKGKEAVYKKATEIGQKIETREGRIGKAADIVERTVEEGKRIYYGQRVQAGLSAIKEGLSSLGEKGCTLYDKLKTEISKEGVVDMQKLEGFLKKGAAATEEFGQKAVQTLTEMVEKGWSAVQADYDKIIPSKEELESKYAGIGTDYKGVLLRRNCEDCLIFYAEAKKKLPGSLKTREQILSNIKASASANMHELFIYCNDKYSDARRKYADKSPEAKFAHSVVNDACWYLNQKEQGFKRQTKYRRNKML
ncbi:hypothetical protein JW756_01085 [Candidatus Woesearchaeota archaeon]|nr:hypothetical protein [Candidatus Woesearchaeota archaeon]